MTKRKHSREDRLAALYARIPDVDCKGLCHAACGPVEISDLEREHVDDAGVDIPPLDPERLMEQYRSDSVPDCPALTPLKRCAVYEHRPTICRLYGTAACLDCEHGCVPTSGLLSREEAGNIIRDSLLIR